jgi:serine protease Do
MAQKLTKRSIAIICAVTILLSAVFGFSGAYLAVSLYSEPVVTAAGSSVPAEIDLTYLTTGADSSCLVESSGENLSIPEIYEKTSESVVEISTEIMQTAGGMGQYIFSGAGSGVVITANGYIVTNNHVIEGAQTITVTLNNGESYEASLIGRDSRTDIAVLKVEASGLKPAHFGDSDTIIVGEQAIVIGNPLGELGGTVTEGIISALDREIVVNGEGMTLLQTSAAVNPGNSGGGLFNNRGEMIGIINAKTGGFNVEGLGFAIPINVAAEVMEQIIEYGYVPGRPVLGVRLLDITDPGTAAYYRVPTTGVYVYETVGLNNLQAGDRLISIGDRAINSITDVREAVDSYEVGETVIITVQRGNNQVELPVTLIEATP